MNEQSPLFAGRQSKATIKTEKGSRYLQQLCKHFGHKIPVEFDAHSGQIAFPFGTCRLGASAGGLSVSCNAADEAQLTRLQEVIGSHLLRFAFREDLQIDWQAA